MKNIVYLALGANIDPAKNMQRGIDILRTYFDVADISPVYQTAPVGFQDQDDFLNAALLMYTDKSPSEVKSILLHIEEVDLGRVRDPNNKSGPRPLDLDIVLWNDDILDYGDKLWHIPDKDVATKSYVAKPLSDIAPDYIHPEITKSIADITAELDTSDMIYRQDILLR